MYLCFAFPLPDGLLRRASFPNGFPRHLFEEAIAHFQDPSTHRLSVHDDLSSGGFDPPFHDVPPDGPDAWDKVIHSNPIAAHENCHLLSSEFIYLPSPTADSCTKIMTSSGIIKKLKMLHRYIYIYISHPP